MSLYPLGRHREHDERSRSFSADWSSSGVRSVTWDHVGPVLDQGHLGSCTGNAVAQALNTLPLLTERASRTGNPRLLAEPDAVRLYTWATGHDNVPGQMPDNDTGSSGLAAAKAAKHFGLIREYRHCFGIEHTLSALSLGPVVAGIPWFEDMFTPDQYGYLPVSGDEAGGHEILLLGLDTEQENVTMLNSWGDSWGDVGRVKIRWDDLGRLLDNGGDCTVLIG